MTLKFRKKNDVHLELYEGEKSDIRLLSDYFTFEVPGAKFSPAYRNKFWDGKIRLFNTQNYTLYAGLVYEIVKFSKMFDVDVDFVGDVNTFPGKEVDIEEEFLDGFLNALEPHDNGKRIEMRDYQVSAFKNAVRKQRCLLLSPTASGKSLIIYSLIRWWREIHNRKILIIVPTIGLVSQMISDFRNYSDGKFNDVQGIMGGTTKEVNSRVVVSTWQSIFNQPAKWFAQFGSVVVDEVHTAQAKSLKGIMEKLIVCPDRVGLTGTLQDSHTHELVLKGLFGPVKKMITTKELMERDQISQMKVHMVQFDYSEADRKECSKYDYQQEIEFLTTHEKRNKIIARMASTLSGNTLVVFQRIEHGKTLYDLIDTTKDKQYVAGETNKDTREEYRQMAEDTDVVIVASLGVFSTGINIKNLHNLIFAHPTKSKIKVLQSIGRILRKHDSKAEATVYDIVDDLATKSRKNFALRHAEERYKHYTIENFTVKTNKVDLK